MRFMFLYLSVFHIAKHKSNSKYLKSKSRVARTDQHTTQAAIQPHNHPVPVLVPVTHHTVPVMALVPSRAGSIFGHGFITKDGLKMGALRICAKQT